MSFESELRDAMSAYDLHIDSINLETGIYHRFRSKGTCKKNCCEYRIFENNLGAHFKCFRRDIDKIWFSANQKKVDFEERAAMNRERLRIEKLRNDIYKEKGRRCAEFFDHIGMMQLHGLNIESHSYAQRKCITPFEARVAKKWIVLPIRNIEYQIQSLQFINAIGFKKFKSGAKIKGGMIWLCDQLPNNYGDVIRICEGWSTGCTIREITRSPVICCLNASNMPFVATLIRQKYPAAIIKICADNDQWGKENTGLKAAIDASECARAPIYWPDFTNLKISTRPTDFNDLAFIAGTYEAKRQLKLLRK